MIRLVTENDLDSVDRIYNQAIRSKFCTAHLTPLTQYERLEWYRVHAANNFPAWVCEIDKTITGWISLSPYRPGRAALNEVAEISIYVDIDSRGKGIGSQLVNYCLEQAGKLNKRIYFAIIIEGNKSSLALLRKFGFVQWGYLPQVINVNGELRGQMYMGKIIRDMKI